VTPKSASQEQEAGADEIQGIHVVRRVSGAAIHSNLHTLSASGTFLCSPYDGKDGPCERSKHILSSMRQTGDVLFLKVTYASEFFDQNIDTDDTLDEECSRCTYTRHAVLYPTISGFGLLQVLESKIALDQFVQPPPKRVDTRQFQMSMMEKPWGKLGGFVDQVKSRTRSKHSSQLARTPENVLALFKCPQLESHALPPVPPQSTPTQTNPFMEAR